VKKLNYFSTVKGIQDNKQQDNKQQATSNKQQDNKTTYIMATQNIGIAYIKLASAWDKKRGARDFQANVFNNTTKNEPMYHVAMILNRALCDIYINTTKSIVEELKCIEPNKAIVSPNGSIWVYDMRHSDAAPRTEQDAEHLKQFVSLFIKKHFDASTQHYLNENLTITMCFFAWFFATPNYFYATKEMRQTTRYGIEKIWTETLARKKPIHTSHRPAPPSHPKQRGMMHQKNVLPKLEEDKLSLQSKINELVNPEHVIDWTDIRTVHKQVSECLENNTLLSGKKIKKLQTLYQQQEKIQEKIERTKEGIKHAEFQAKKNNKLQTAEPETTEPEIAEPEIAEPEIAEPEIAEPETREEEEDVPESWEDLML
jgi:hypothetical protein